MSFINLNYQPEVDKSNQTGIAAIFMTSFRTFGIHQNKLENFRMEDVYLRKRTFTTVLPTKRQLFNLIKAANLPYQLLADNLKMT